MALRFRVEITAAKRAAFQAHQSVSLWAVLCCAAVNRMCGTMSNISARVRLVDLSERVTQSFNGSNVMWDVPIEGDLVISIRVLTPLGRDHLRWLLRYTPTPSAGIIGNTVLNCHISITTSSYTLHSL